MAGSVDATTAKNSTRHPPSMASPAISGNTLTPVSVLLLSISENAGIGRVRKPAQQAMRSGLRPIRSDNAPIGTITISIARRSEEHTSELQSRENLLCRLL